MPHTVQFRPTLIDVLLTNERMASYQQVFKPTSDLELVGVYLWNSQVCSSLYPLVSAAEVALRNAVDQALVKELGAKWWSKSTLKYQSHGKGGAPPFPVRVVIDNFSGAYDKAQKAARQRLNKKNVPAPSHGSIVANTDFSTWEFLLDHEFMGRGLIWPKLLGQVFRGPWPDPSASKTLTDAKNTVKTVREFRNRLFHHEPAWKRFNVATESDAIQHLQEKIDRIEELITLIHPEKTKLLQRNGFLPAARRLCSAEEIRRYQKLHKRNRIGTLRKLQAVIDAAYAGNRAVEVTTFSGTSRRFLVSPLP